MTAMSSRSSLAGLKVGGSNDGNVVVSGLKCPGGGVGYAPKNGNACRPTSAAAVRMASSTAAWNDLDIDSRVARSAHVAYLQLQLQLATIPVTILPGCDISVIGSIKLKCYQRGVPTGLLHLPERCLPNR